MPDLHFFIYNPASQIASRLLSPDSHAWTGAYNVSRPYAANGLNQYTLTGTIVPTYDGRGNLTSAGATTYSYDSENRLTGASSGVALAYDPAGRLYRVASGAAGTRMLYDGVDRIAEYNDSGQLLRRYVHGPGTDEPLLWYEGAMRHWLHPDERGSIVAVTGDFGAILGRNSYDDFGIPGAGNVGRFQYTGQAWVPELGLYYYKARFYSPTLGRFLQTDPIGYGDGMNLYAYVGNDPVNFTDPSGLTAGDIIVTGTRPPLAIMAIDGFAGFADPLMLMQGQAKKNVSSIKLRPSTKKYLCGKLSAHGFDMSETYSDIKSFRDSSRRNMLIPESREAENWLYATGQWRDPPTDGSTKAGVYVYQYTKPVFSPATPFSRDALNAGLNGVDNVDVTEKELREYCNAN